MTTSCGKEGFKNAKKKSVIAGQATGAAAANRMLRRNINTVRVKVSCNYNTLFVYHDDRFIEDSIGKKTVVKEDKRKKTLNTRAPLYPPTVLLLLSCSSVKRLLSSINSLHTFAFTRSYSLIRVYIPCFYAPPSSSLVFPPPLVYNPTFIFTLFFFIP